MSRITDHASFRVSCASPAVVAVLDAVASPAGVPVAPVRGSPCEAAPGAAVSLDDAPGFPREAAPVVAAFLDDAPASADPGSRLEVELEAASSLKALLVPIDPGYRSETVHATVASPGVALRVPGCCLPSPSVPAWVRVEPPFLRVREVLLIERGFRLLTVAQSFDRDRCRGHRFLEPAVKRAFVELRNRFPRPRGIQVFDQARDSMLGLSTPVRAQLSTAVRGKDQPGLVHWDCE